MNIEEIKSQLNIVSIANNLGIKLAHKNSAGYCIAPCPFNHEHKGDPFSINVTEQFYNCMGCGIGGDSIDLYMKVKNVDFVDAIKDLCGIYGIEADLSNLEKDEEYDVKELSEYDIKCSLYESIYEYGRKLLLDCSLRDYHNIAIETYKYLTELRGYSKEFLENTSFCVIPDQSHLRKRLIQLHPEHENLIKDHTKFKITGFAGDKCPLGIPLRNPRGKIIGFQRRSIIPKGVTVAYENQKPIENHRWDFVYHTEEFKKDFLFGIGSIKYKTEDLFIVEGTCDTLLLNYHNIPTVGLLQGIYSEKYNYWINKKKVQSVTFLLDRDEAGFKNILSSVLVMLKDFDNIYIIDPNEMKPYKDPDEFLSKDTIEKLKSVLDKKMLWYDYIYSELEKKYKDKELIDNLLEYHSKITTAFICLKSFDKIKEITKLKSSEINKLLKVYRSELESKKQKISIIKQFSPNASEIESKLKPIGYISGTFAIMNYEPLSPELRYLSDTQIFNPNTLLSLLPDLAFWENNFGEHWKSQAPLYLVNLCHKTNSLKDCIIRSSGLWWDSHKIIFNDGSKVWEVNNSQLKPMNNIIHGSHIYVTGMNIKVPENINTSDCCNLVKDLEELIKLSSMDSSMHEIFMGNLFNQQLIGVYQNIPAESFQGPSDVGKTTIQKIKVELSYNLHTMVSSSSTLASITNRLNPVPIPLSEANKTNFGEQDKMDKLMDCTKDAWDGSSSTKMKDGEPISLEIKKQFSFTSVSRPEQSEEMSNRFFNYNLEVRERSDIDNFMLKWNIIEPKLRTICDYFFLKALKVAPMIRESVLLFIEHFSKVYKGQKVNRYAAKYAYAMIGYHFIYNDSIPTIQQLDNLIKIAISHISKSNEFLDENGHKIEINMKSEVQSHDLFDEIMQVSIQNIDDNLKRTNTNLYGYCYSQHNKHEANNSTPTSLLYGIGFNREFMYISASNRIIKEITKKLGHPTYSNLLKNLSFCEGIFMLKIDNLPKQRYLKLNMLKYFNESSQNKIITPEEQKKNRDAVNEYKTQEVDF